MKSHYWFVIQFNSHKPEKIFNLKRLPIQSLVFASISELYEQLCMLCMCVIRYLKKNILKILLMGESFNG